MLGKDSVRYFPCAVFQERNIRKALRGKYCFEEVEIWFSGQYHSKKYYLFPSLSRWNLERKESRFHVNSLEPLKKRGLVVFFENRADLFGRSGAKKTVSFGVQGIHI